MNYILIAIIVALVVMTVYSLVRGIVAFLRGAREDIDRDPTAGPSQNQLFQNKMMFARIKYQAAAVVVVAILLAISHK